MNGDWTRWRLSKQVHNSCDVLCDYKSCCQVQHADKGDPKTLKNHIFVAHLQTKRSTNDKFEVSNSTFSLSLSVAGTLTNIIFSCVITSDSLCTAYVVNYLLLLQLKARFHNLVYLQSTFKSTDSSSSSVLHNAQFGWKSNLASILVRRMLFKIRLGVETLAHSLKISNSTD